MIEAELIQDLHAAKEACRVSRCEVSECAYNMDKACHAIAIHVASGPHPICGTFLKSMARSGTGSRAAHVGSCKASACRHNSGFQCGAPNIQVDYCWGYVDCRTFALR